MTSLGLTLGIVAFAGLAACAPEATAPEGAAAVGRVVPVVVPDTWCSIAEGSAADTTRTPKPCQPTAKPQSQGSQDTTWRAIEGSLEPAQDSSRTR